MSGELVKHQGVPATLPDKMQYAKALAESGMLPGQYRKQPANLLYALEYAESLDLHPMAAITGIHVIEGKPSASAALISALVRRAGHKLRVRGDDTEAVAQIVRADDPEFTFEARWTMERAEQAGLARKQVWKNYPAAMLKARAITEVARDACEEALSGMHYTPEELGATVDQDGEPVDAPVQQLHRVQPGEPDAWAAPAQPGYAEAEGDLTGGRDFINEATEAADAAAVRAVWQAAKASGAAAHVLNEIVAIGKEKAASEQAPATEPDADGVVDVETVPAGADEHAAAVAELKAFAAEHGITDLDAAVYPHLGAPLDDVSAGAIRQLTQQLRASAA